MGKTEEQLKEEGVDYKVGKFSFMANSRARTVDTAEGLVKFITDATTDKASPPHTLSPVSQINEPSLRPQLPLLASSGAIVQCFHSNYTSNQPGSRLHCWHLWGVTLQQFDPFSRFWRLPCDCVGRRSMQACRIAASLPASPYIDDGSPMCRSWDATSWAPTQARALPRPAWPLRMPGLLEEGDSGPFQDSGTSQVPALVLRRE